MSTVSKTVKTEKKFKELIKAIFSSRLFPFVTAAVMILCYYLSLDMVAIYYVAITGILILLFCDDLTPFFTTLLFINVVVSFKNSPSSHSGASDYYFQPYISCQVITLITLLVGFGAMRILKSFRHKKFKPTPVFWGLCALSAVFVLNGLFSEGYTVMNFVYGLFLTAIYLGIFMLIKENVKMDKATFKNVAINFFAFSILLVAELVIAYVTYDGLIVDGQIHREILKFGWGVYNTMGMLLLVCVPAAIYLATVCKRGWLFTLYSLVLVLACVLSLSRQAMLGIAIIYPLSLILLFKKSPHKLINACIIIGAAVAAIAVLALNWNGFIFTLSRIFDDLFVNGEFYAGDRMGLTQAALMDFANAPIFGVGFYGASLGGTTLINASGLDIIPLLYHNTFLQMLGSCGLIGLVVYVVHRMQTIISFFKNVNAERSYVAIAILSLLILSMLDVHMFDILPIFMYSSLLALMVATEKKKTEKVKRLFIIKV